MDVKMVFDPQRLFDWQLRCGDEHLTAVCESMERPYNSPVPIELKAVFREMADVDVLGKLEKWIDDPRQVQLHLVNTSGLLVEIWYSSDARLEGRIMPTTRLDYSANDIGRFEATISATWKRLRVA